MDIKVTYSDEPAFVLQTAGKFLASQPVLHNITLTVLHARNQTREVGRYWIGIQGGETLGVALQSPLTFPATVTPMKASIVAALVNAIADQDISLPGVNGDAATAASFAGQWAERCNIAATPVRGYRLHELLELPEAPNVEGNFRQAISRDRSLMIDWTRDFHAEVGESETLAATELRVDRALSAGELWLWETGETVSMAVNHQPVEHVVRISGVYTPPDKRKRGYAEACVYALSRRLRDAGHRCILYTDLANPTSNSIYRHIGYRAVAEALRYRFG